MATVYCIFKILADDTKKFEGVATNKEIAKAAIKDGNYLVCPIETDRRYDADIASEAFPGAVLVRPVVLDLQQDIMDALSDLSGSVSTLDTFVRSTVVPQVQNELSGIKTRLDALENPS